jgi:hypothetical protein
MKNAKLKARQLSNTFGFFILHFNFCLSLRFFVPSSLCDFVLKNQ